jgi:CheY-like chemotaxis protein
MRIIFFTGDLVFPSRVAGVARRLGAQMNVVASAEALSASFNAAPQQGAVVLLDLNSPAVDVADVVARIKTLGTVSVIVAFGPHVHEAKLDAARAAGCDFVLTRGQFDSQMEAILSKSLSMLGQDE